MTERKIHLDTETMLPVLGIILTLLLGFLYLTRHADAQTVSKTTCPTDESCRVLLLTKTEEEILLGERGILTTAAQARSLDLGQYVAYFRQKIMSSPAGESTPVPAPKAETAAPKK